MIQSKAKSSQDVLNYPIRLNNELVALAGSVSSADAAPTTQAYQVFDMLKQRSDEWLGQWDQVAKNDISAFNQLVRQQDVAAIILDTTSSAATGAASGPDQDKSPIREAMEKK